MHTPLDYSAAMRELDRLVAVGEDRVRRTTIGSSIQGRSLTMLDISDPNVTDDHKERAVLTAGHHGMEPGGVRGCLKTLGWLLEGEGQPLLKCLAVRCIPMVNPDGLVIDNARNANGVNLDMNYQAADGLTEPETKAVWEAVSEFQPEAAIDMHNFAATHSSVYIHPRDQTLEDEEIANRIAKRIYERCENNGFPMWEPAWLEGYPKNILSLSHRCHKEFHTFPIVPETNEAQFEPDEEAECGRIMVSSILELAAVTSPGQLEPGFPVRTIKNGHTADLYARGETAAQRRSSRIELWSHRNQIEIRDCLTKWRGHYQIVLEDSFCPQHGVGLRFRLPKWKKIAAVERDGVELSKSPLNGYQIREDAYSIYLYLDIGYFESRADVSVNYNNDARA
ncbi:MAG: M14 family zinc carboxypeptidase [bacterium]